MKGFGKDGPKFIKGIDNGTSGNAHSTKRLTAISILPLPVSRYFSAHAFPAPSLRVRPEYRRTGRKFRHAPAKIASRRTLGHPAGRMVLCKSSKEN